jgi:hypothetical protein
MNFGYKSYRDFHEYWALSASTYRPVGAVTLWIWAGMPAWPTPCFLCSCKAQSAGNWLRSACSWSRLSLINVRKMWVFQVCLCVWNPVASLHLSRWAQERAIRWTNQISSCASRIAGLVHLRAFVPSWRQAWKSWNMFKNSWSCSLPPYLSQNGWVFLYATIRPLETRLQQGLAPWPRIKLANYKNEAALLQFWLILIPMSWFETGFECQVQPHRFLCKIFLQHNSLGTTPKL